MTDHRVVLLYGPRQAGKTTLARKVLDQTGKRSLSLSGDVPSVAELLSSLDPRRLSSLAAGYDILFIDEAQRIENVGMALKILHDGTFSGTVFVTASSSLDLASKASEALTGRAWTFTLFPIAFAELAAIENNYELGLRREEAMVLGSYPALFSMEDRQDRVEHLVELSKAYLYKDILELSGIRNPAKLRDLLRLLAYRIGSEVSYQELGRQLGMSADTVLSYIDLLEKAYVVFRLGGYSRNLRKEVTKKDKVYFFDNGIRNSLLEDFKELPQRGDVGQLWENFLVAERRKLNAYGGYYGGSWFWRTHTGAEIDYVEEVDGHLSGFEFKSSVKPLRAPTSWTVTYPEAGFAAVNPDNYLDFIAGRQ